MTVSTEEVGAQQAEKSTCPKSDNEPAMKTNEIEGSKVSTEAKAEVAVADTQDTEKADHGAEKDAGDEPETGGNVDQEMDTEENLTGEVKEAGSSEAHPTYPKKGFPLTLGPKTFTCVEAAVSYFKKLIADWPVNCPMNEYEHIVVGALLHDCHPRAKAKIKSGVVSFKVKQPMASCQRKCLFLCREDGTEEDFSYLKCLSAVAGHDLVKNVRDGWKGPRNGEKERNNKYVQGRGRGRGRGRGGRGGRSGRVSKR